MVELKKKKKATQWVNHKCMKTLVMPTHNDRNTRTPSPYPPKWPGFKFCTLQLVYDLECHTVALYRRAKRVLHQTINRKRASKQPTENASKKKVVHKKCIPPDTWGSGRWRRPRHGGGRQAREEYSAFNCKTLLPSLPLSPGLLQGTPGWGFLPYNNPLTFLWLVLIAWRQSREEEKKRTMRRRVHWISGCTIRLGYITLLSP